MPSRHFNLYAFMVGASTVHNRSHHLFGSLSYVPIAADLHISTINYDIGNSFHLSRAHTPRPARACVCPRFFLPFIILRRHYSLHQLSNSTGDRRSRTDNLSPDQRSVTARYYDVAFIVYISIKFKHILCVCVCLPEAIPTRIIPIDLKHWCFSHLLCFHSSFVYGIQSMVHVDCVFHYV